LANLINQQGGGLSDIIGQGGVNAANLMSGAGQALGGQQMSLAQLLANLSIGQGSQLAGLQGQIGQAQAGGTIGRAAALRGGAGSLAGGIQAGLGASAGGAGLGSSILSGLGSFLSDDRLKKDIKKIGEQNGFNVYEWAWNGLLGLSGKARGVLASDVILKMPEAIEQDESGYNKVNYSMIGVNYAAI
jgi:hypothetical protein